MSAGAGSLTARVGEMRRLTFMYCDVVGSTELSRVHSLEAYHDLMEGYRRACVDVIEQRFEGHIVHYKGDGVLSAFGYPVAHENDAERAVRAALALVEAVGEVRSAETGEALAIRVGVHNGTVYRKLDEDEILGFATNIGARYETLADPGTVVVSDEVRQLVEAHFELEAGEPQPVKGTPEPLQPFRVVGERHVRAPRAWMAPLIGRDGELRALRATLESGAKGVLVWGEPGVGKSRLVAALTDELETVRLHGSPFHADAGLHPVRGLLERRCGLRPEATAAERLADLAAEVEARGAGRRRRPAAGAGARARARRRLRARRGRGTAARGPGQPDRPGLSEGLRAGRGRRGPALVRRRHAGAAGARRPRRRVGRGHLAPLRARQLGGDRAAAARPRGPARADRRARARPAGRLPRGARRPQRRHPALRRGAGARGPGGRARRHAGARVGARGALRAARRAPVRDAGRAGRGRDRRRGGPGRRALAAGGHDGAGRRASWTPRWARSSPRASSSRSTTPASASATSCCARSPTSCSRRRGGG